MAVFCRKERRSYDPKWHIIFYSFCGFVTIFPGWQLRTLLPALLGLLRSLKLIRVWKQVQPELISLVHPFLHSP